MAEFERWDEFYPWFADNWAQGEHVVFVGRAGSGKTVMALQVLPIRGHTVVFATKAEDSSLYKPLLKQGFVMTDKFDPSDRDGPSKVLFKPKLLSPTKDAIEKQREAFRTALVGLFVTGGWCLYLDEVRYLSQNLGLTNELDQLWLQGRSLGVTMVCATQRPVSVPLNAFEQATHFFVFRVTDRQDRARASEYMGVNAPMAMETLAGLPRHEALYVDAVEDYATRTMVQ